MKNNKQVTSSVGDTFLRSAKKRKAVGTITLLTTLMAASFAAAFYVGGSNDASALENSTVLKADGAAPDFSSETEVDNSEFGITVTTAAITDNSETFRATFTSKKIEAYNNSSRYEDVFVSIVDSDWTTEADARAIADANQKAAEEGGTEYAPLQFDAYVYYVEYSSRGDIIIPRVVNSGTRTVNGESTFTFQMNIIGIYSTAFLDEDTNEPNYDDIESVTIPKTVQVIEEGAFAGALEAGVAVKTQATEAEVAELSWAEGWIDDPSQVEYGAEYDDDSRQAAPTTTSTRSFGSGVDFSIGSFLEISGHDEYYQPMYVTFDILDASGKVVDDDVVMELPLTSTNSDYDAVGSSVGSTSLSKNIDISLTAGANYRVDPDSLTFHNIYHASQQQIGGVFYAVPNVEDGAFFCTPRVSLSYELKVSDLVSYRSGTNSVYGDYLLVSCIFDVNAGYYAELNPTAYNNNKAALDAGTMRIRTLFYSIPNSSYNIIYERDGQDVAVTLPVSTPIDSVEITSGSSFGFLINVKDVGEGFSYDAIKEIYLEGFYLRMDLYNTDTNAIANTSAVTTRFYTLNLMPEGKPSSVSIPVLMIVVYVCYFVLFIGGSVAYYFYSKNKFKNDEFRRMDTRKYVRSAILNMVGFALVLSSILFIILRWGFLKSSVVVYNPTDVFVIVFTVAALIFLGITIRNIVVAVRTNHERKVKERLKIDQDKVEDGTN